MTGAASAPWVCVTGAGGDIGHGIVRGLQAGANPPRTFALDWSADCAAFHYADRGAQVPPSSSDEYVEVLCERIREVDAKLLFLGVDEEIPKLARCRELVREQAGCDVVVASCDVVDAATDKLVAASWLAAMGVGTPATFGVRTATEVIQHVGLPLLAKPRRGNGSAGIERLDSEQDLAEFLARGCPDYCFQEYIDGPEFTVGLLFDEEGALVDSLTMERVLVQGRTEQGAVRRHAAIDACVESFARASGATGPMNLQLRLNADGEAHVFEVNPRISGSTALRVAVGFNDPLRIYEDRVLGIPMRAVDVPIGKRVYRVAAALVVEGDAQ